LTWANGAIATLYNAVEPDQLRGPQHHAAWCDELAKWQYAGDTRDQLQFGLRLGHNPQSCITTTSAADFAAQEHHERSGHRDNAGLDFEQPRELGRKIP
jgi:phage terminase large subunit-like protein